MDRRLPPPYALLEAIDIQVALGAAPQPRVVPATSWVWLGALVLMAFALGLRRILTRRI